MRSWVVAGLLATFGVLCACSGKDHQAFTDVNENPSSGGQSGSQGGHAGSATGGQAEPAGGTGGTGDALKGPTVIITSPIDIGFPDKDGILIDTMVTVKCSAHKSPLEGSSPVDPSTVQIEILDADGMSIDHKHGIATTVVDEYSSDFVLTDVPSGRVGFRCTASDSARPMATSSATIQTFVDHGPKITATSPAPMSAHTLDGALPIEFTVDAVPLVAGDTGAQVGDVKVTIDGITVPVTEAPDAPGTYRGTATFTDGTQFPTTPNGDTPVVITATNQRTPTPVTSIDTYQFSIDSAGPVITVMSPTDKIVVGGTVTLQFKIQDDAAGVDDKTVVVSINDEDHPFDLTQNWTKNGDNYTFRFDSANVGTSKVQVTINIRASDKVGNASPGTSLLLYLDNKPPIIDLDPANIRERNSLTNECSISFDPVGDLAVNDLDGSLGIPVDGAYKHYPINVAARFRALVFEDTNSVDGISFLHYAGTNASTVRLYVQPNPATAATPLLVDKNGDGVCDEIGDVDNINFSVMDKVAPGGSPYYGQDSTTAPLPVGCTLKTGTAPPTLCSQVSDMWHVLTHEKATGSETIVYSVKVNTGIECTGIDWEFGSYANADGWVCFAVRAVDNVGNVGVSRPLRVCMDDLDRPGEPACKNSSTVPPTCTDGCTPPPRADLGILSY